MKPFPSHVYILGVRFRIEVSNDLRDEEGDLLDGEMARQKGNVIRIAQDLNTRKKWETLIHESLHAILDVAGGKFNINNGDAEREETIVRQLESGIILLLEQYGKEISKHLINEYKEEKE